MANTEECQSRRSLFKKIKFFFKEITNLYHFAYKTKAEEKTVIFYSEHKNYYPNFEGIIDCLINRHQQQFCYITSDPDDPILKTKRPQIKTFYINKLLLFFMPFVNCKVFIMTMTDLGQLHIWRSINPVQYVYVFHSLVSVHMSYRYGAFDHYDVILCAGPHHVEEIRKNEASNKLPQKRLIQAGHYRLERIYEAYKKYTEKNTFSNSNSKGVVLIAPSWGLANILESCGEELVDLLLTEKYEVIVRPHPETVRRAPDLLNLLTDKFGNNQNFMLETTVVGDESLLKADVLICDCSGVAFEYAFGTERPVLFLDTPVKIRNQRFKELALEPLELSLRPEIGVIISLKKLQTVPEVISDLIVNRPVYKRRITELRQQYVYAFGHSSDIGAQCIIDLAGAEQTDN